MKRRKKHEPIDLWDLSIIILKVINVIAILVAVAVGWGLSNLWRWIFS